jgi:hypothetical protein
LVRSRCGDSVAAQADAFVIVQVPMLKPGRLSAGPGGKVPLEPSVWRL